MTSWQSGETPCGKSAGDMSVTSPPKISMGASNDPAVVIWLPKKICQRGCSSPLLRGEDFLAPHHRLFIQELACAHENPQASKAGLSYRGWTYAWSASRAR